MIIDDSTNLSRIRGAEHGGYIPRDFIAEPQGCNGFAAPFSMPLIPETEWADRIRQMQKDGTMLSDIMADAGIPPLHQGQSNYCAPFSAVDGVICVEVLQGKTDVRLSAASVAAPLNGYRNTGNWVSRCLKFIVANGVATLQTWPGNHFANDSYDNAASREDRKKHNVTEWWDGSPDPNLAFRQMMTCLLQRLPCPAGFSWMRHAVNCVDPAMDERGRTFGFKCRNSGLYRDRTGHTTLLGQKAIPNEFFAPRVALRS